MKTRSPFRNAQSGSTLLAAMIVIVILSFAAAGVLSYSLTTYRNSKRQALLDQAREYSDSEMQYLYFEWKNAILGKKATTAANIVTYLGTYPTPSTNATPESCVALPGASIATNLTPSSNAIFAGSPGETWTVSRTIDFDNKNVAGSTTTNGSALGVLSGTGGQVGQIFYYTAKTRATLTSPILGSIEFHSGRTFQYSSSSLFRYALFYEGNLEIAAGGDMVINGPITTNASAYLGTQPAYTLTLSDTVSYFEKYNGALDPMTGEVDRLEGSGALNDPTYNPNPNAAAPAAGAPQTAQRAIQVSKLTQQLSFTGGVDVAGAIAAYPNAYLNPNSNLVDPNEVYRAVIAPPPLYTATGNYTGTPGAVGTAIPEDQAVANSRMYNSAGIIITINQGTSGLPTVQVGYADPEGGTQTHLNAYYDSTQPVNSRGVLETYMPTILANSAAATGVRAPNITDMREKANGVASVNLTTLDVSALNTALQALIPTQTAAGQIGYNIASGTGNGYNGVVYVNDTTPNTAAGGGTPGTLNAILLKNGATTPAFNDSSGNPLGFTVVTNNGLYVQGDYNVSAITVDGATAPNPCALMGDAITALSPAWQPTPAATAAPMIVGGNYVGRQAAPDPTPVDPTILASPGLESMTINAAILTGNTPSTSGTGAYGSGGAQNLVRMEEDWYDPDGGLTLNLKGSLGQLFNSDYFDGPYRNGPVSWMGGDAVYAQPTTRNVVYDSTFGTRTPYGSPTTTTFTIGPFFSW